MIALTLQTSGQALVIKWSWTRSDAEPYLNSSVILFSEILKTVAALVLVFCESESPSKAVESIRESIMLSPNEMLRAAVPTLVYTIQNNLMFYSLEKLSAGVQQVLYQMKILATAGLGVLMLGKTLSQTEWSACLLLTLGIALVQWPRPAEQGEVLGDQYGSLGGDKLKGFAAVLVACFTSGFAAVYIQRMLQQTAASIWVRNVQFGLWSSALSLCVCLSYDGGRVWRGGLTQGFSPRVLLVVLMTAGKGLVSAFSLKHSGATLGCFSTALSIVLTSALSAVLLHDFVPDQYFVVGTALAVTASLLFGLGLPEPIRACVREAFRPPSAAMASYESKI